MLFACAGVVLAQARAPDTPQPDRYIVVLKEDADPEQGADKAQREHGAKVRHVYDGKALNGYAAVIPTGRLAALSQDPDVAFINKDAVVYADISTGGATGVDRIDGEPNSADVSDGSGAKAAVLDTGIDLEHPDLNVVNGINAVSTTGTIYSDCSLGRTNTSADDVHGHGTHVAGTIGAKNNTSGVVGVAPGAKLYAVKVLNDQGSGYVSDIICGINWVTSTHTDADTTNDIDTANMSLGGTGSDDGQSCATTTIAYKKAICNSVGEGVTYVVSAGNDGADLATKRPASYRDGTKPLVLTVTAIADYNGQPGGGAAVPSGCTNYGSDDTPASFSNYATTTVNQEHTIAAPGVCILSTAPGGGTTTKSGTSMAAPHIAGTVALCLRSGGSCSSSGATTPGQIINKLRTDAQAQPGHPTYGWSGAPGTSKYYGYLEYAGSYRSGAAPDTTITSGPAEGSKTNSTSASFTYSSSEPSSTFECSLNGAAFSSCPDTGQSYSGLGDGQHVFEVRAKNSAGTTDPTPAKRTWTVDATSPETTISSGPSGAVNSSSASFSFSSSESGATFECSLDGSAWSSCSSPSSYTNLADGSHTFEVRAKDAAGNTDSTPASRTWTVDTTPPETTIDSGPSGTVTSNSASFTFSSSESGATFECRLDNEAFSPCNSPKDYTNLADGSRTFEVRAKDAAGNTDSTPASRTWTVDATTPTVSSVAPSEGATGVAHNINVTATFSEEMDASTLTTTSTFTLVKEGSTTPIAATVSYDAATKTAMLNPDVDLEASTTYTATVKSGTGGAKDVAGTTLATDKVWSFTTAAPLPSDTTPPETTIDSGPSGTVTSSSASFTFSSESGATFECRLDGGTWETCTSPKNYSSLADGSHTFEVRAIDSAGNTDSTPASRTWTVDAKAPTVSSTDPSSGATGVGRGSDVTAFFSEDVQGVTTSTFTLVRNGTTSPLSATVSYSYDATAKAWKATLNPSSDLRRCTLYNATVTTGVKDKAGNALDQDPNATGNQPKTWSFRTTGCS